MRPIREQAYRKVGPHPLVKIASQSVPRAVLIYQSFSSQPFIRGFGLSNSKRILRSINYLNQILVEGQWLHLRRRVYSIIHSVGQSMDQLSLLSALESSSQSGRYMPATRWS